MYGMDVYIPRTFIREDHYEEVTSQNSRTILSLRHTSITLTATVVRVI